MQLIKTGDNVKLVAKTRHGRNRISEHGAIVKVDIVTDSRICTISSDDDWRWIDIPDDKNFFVVLNKF